MIDAILSESEDALRTFAPDLTAYLDTYDEAVPENILFRQKVLAALRAMRIEGPADKVADEVLARLSDIPDRHPGATKARSLLVAVLLRGGLGFHGRQLDKITAVRKAATAVVAYVAGIRVGELTLALKDEAWLLDPTPLSERTDWFTTLYWACCSAWAGVGLAHVVLNAKGLLTDYDPDLCDGFDRAVDRMKVVVESRYDYNNLIDYAIMLAGWAKKAEGFQALTEALLAERSLTTWEVEDVLAEHGVFPASLRFHDRVWPQIEVGLEDAPGLLANDPSTVVYVSQVRQTFDDGPVLPLGVPIRC